MAAMIRSLTVTAIVLLVLAVLAAVVAGVPPLSRAAKRALRIPVESSGPHYPDGTGADIPGSSDFLFCAISRTSPAAACAVAPTGTGWRVTSAVGSDPRACAAMCLK